MYFPQRIITYWMGLSKSLLVPMFSIVWYGRFIPTCKKIFIDKPLDKLQTTIFHLVYQYQSEIVQTHRSVWWKTFSSFVYLKFVVSAKRSALTVLKTSFCLIQSFTAPNISHIFLRKCGDATCISVFVTKHKKGKR